MKINESKSFLDFVFKFDDEKWNLIKNEAKLEFSKANMILDDLKKNLLLNKYCIFMPMNMVKEKDGRTYRGELVIEEFKEIDSIILKKEDAKTFTELCEFDSRTTFRLIYRGSLDGFEPNEFHSKCDNIPNTITIIKSENGNIFGGYTTQTWNSVTDLDDLDDGDNKTDENAFIFSFLNKHNKPIKIKIKESAKKNAIYCSKFLGPNFGSYDIEIKDKYNAKSSLGFNYFLPIDFIDGYNWAKGSNCADEINDSFLAGENKFILNEIEVFQVVKI